MKTLAILFLLTGPLFGIGRVTQTLTQLGGPQGPNWVASFAWTGDAVTGSVPVTFSQGMTALDGYEIVGVEARPGSPAPTNNYSLTVMDQAGFDILAGTGLSAVSATVGQSFLIAAATTPVIGTVPAPLTITITGNTVGGAQGVVFIFLQKPGNGGISRSTLSGGGGVTFFGPVGAPRTGSVTTQTGDYTVGMVTGAVPVGACAANQVGIQITTSGITCTSLLLTGSYFANQGTSLNYVLHGNPGGNLAFGPILTPDLPSSGVTPGSYTNTNLTVDATGRILAASNGTGGGAGSFNQLLDYNILASGGASLVIATNASALTPNQIGQGNSQNCLLTAPLSATLSGTSVGGTNQAWIYCTAQGVLTVGHNTASTITCASPCAVATSVTGFPPDSTPLWNPNFTSLVWNTVVPSQDRRAVQRNTVIAAGSGNASAYDPTTGIQTVSTDPTVTPRYFTGSGAPGGTCTAGRDFYTDTTGLHLYFCDATNTWKQVDGGGASPYFAGSLTTIVPGNWTVLGSGCTTTTVTGAGGGNALKIVGSSGAQNTCGDYATVAGGNFTHNFVLYQALSGYNSSEIGVGFSDGTKVEYCAAVATTSFAYTINTISQTTLTSGLGAAVGDAALFPLIGSGPLFLQLVRTGTNLDCNWSPDGQNYVNLFHDTSPFLTADRVVVIVDPRGATKASTVIFASYN